MSAGNGRIIVEIHPRGQNIKGLILKCDSRDNFQDPQKRNIYCSNAVKNSRGYYISKTKTPFYLPAYAEGTGSGLYDIYTCIDSKNVNAWYVNSYNPSIIYPNKTNDSLKQIVTTKKLKTGFGLTLINDTPVRGAIRAYPTYIQLKGPETKILYIPSNDPRWYTEYPNINEAFPTRGNAFVSLKPGTYKISYVKNFEAEEKVYTYLDDVTITMNTISLKSYYYNSPNHIQMTLRFINWFS